MISADGIIKTTRNKRSGGFHLTNFCKIPPKTYLQNIKHNIKGPGIFQLILVVILSILILSIKKRGLGVHLLNGENPLSVTKVICRQSLNGIFFKPQYKV